MPLTDTQFDEILREIEAALREPPVEPSEGSVTLVQMPVMLMDPPAAFPTHPLRVVSR